jgi:hypothetical protein
MNYKHERPADDNTWTADRPSVQLGTREHMTRTEATIDPDVWEDQSERLLRNRSERGEDW